MNGLRLARGAEYAARLVRQFFGGASSSDRASARRRARRPHGRCTLPVIIACCLMQGLAQPAEASDDEIRARVQRVYQGIRAWVEAGRDPRPLTELVAGFQPLMDQGRRAEALKVLDDALRGIEQAGFGAPVAGAAEAPAPAVNSTEAGAPDGSWREPRAGEPAPGRHRSRPRPVALFPIPDSAEIVFHKGGHIFAMDRDGGSVTQITSGEPTHWEHAAVSHDRRFIAANQIVRMEDGGLRSVLWLFDLAAGERSQLVPGFHSAGGGGVDWDPQGFVYFAGEPRKTERRSMGWPRRLALGVDVFRIHRDGSGLEKITRDTPVAEADVAVSTDGSAVVYAAAAALGTMAQHPEIWIADSDGSAPRRVHVGGAHGARGEGAHDPELSPDGSRIVFSKVNSEVPRNFSGTRGMGTAHDLYVMNVDGSGLHRISPPGAISIIPDWKGHLIVYDERNEKDGYLGASLIDLRHPDRPPRRLHQGARMPKWIP